MIEAIGKSVGNVEDDRYHQSLWERRARRAVDLTRRRILRPVVFRVKTVVRGRDLPRRHVIISGTGRCGTTFLVQLCTQLGLDTGYRDTRSAVHDNCDAGMEWDIRRLDSPYVVKSPLLCDWLGPVLESGEVVIEHALIPMRDLHAAAESRRDVTRRARPSDVHSWGVRGGLYYAQDRPEDEEWILAAKLYELIHTLVVWDVPMTFLDFPRIVHDPAYLYEKLAFLLPGTTEDRFTAAFNAVARPELIHDFSAAETTEFPDIA